MKSVLSGVQEDTVFITGIGPYSPKFEAPIVYPLGEKGKKVSGTTITSDNGVRGKHITIGGLNLLYDYLYRIEIRSELIGELFTTLRCDNLCLPKAGFSNFKTAVLEPVKTVKMNLAQRLRQGNLKLR